MFDLTQAIRRAYGPLADHLFVNVQPSGLGLLVLDTYGQPLEPLPNIPIRDLLDLLQRAFQEQGGGETRLATYDPAVDSDLPWADDAVLPASA